MSARTSPISSGSSACWARISTTARCTRYPDGHELWVTTDQPAAEAVAGFRPRHAGLQRDRRAPVLSAGCGGGRVCGRSGSNEQAEQSMHFSYEMVALSPRCCAELGIPLSEEDRKRPYVEVSGRKGLGVKADDLMDKLIAKRARRSGVAAPGSNRRSSSGAWRPRSPSARCATFC